MHTRVFVSALLVLGSCGRTDFFDEGVARPGADGPSPSPVAEEPLRIFRGEVGRCPEAGTEADMRPEDGERLVVARLRLLGECSGAGGHWMIGRLRGETRDGMFGGHACAFIEPPPPEGAGPAAPTAIGVLRYRQTAGLREGPRGWCIDDEDGEEPVTSDGIVQAVATFATEAGALGAVERWSR